MNKEWWLVEAGEYVLGTLRGSERELFEKLLKSDPEAQALVMFWEEQFGSLDAVLDAKSDVTLSLPPRLWENIEARINESQSNQVTQSTERKSKRAVSTGQESSESDSILESLKRKIVWWETIGALSFVACIALATVLLTQWSSFSRDNNNAIATTNAYTIVSVLSAEDGTQLWAIVADETNGQVRAVAIDAPEAQPDQSHQLWVVLPDNQGVESIGLLPYENGSIQTFEIDKDESLSKLRSGSAFAVSVEPPGGTASAAPTGPVISSRAYTKVSEPL